MIFRQLLHASPAIGASYLFGCSSKSACAVVDPMEAPRTYRDMANEFGMQITHVIDTHVHADHLSTGRELASLTGAAYVLHADVEAEFDFEGVRDGDRITLGNTRIDVMHLPGHTPEHIGLLVSDHSRTPDPWFVVTGHTLMVGDMGRTELASSAEDGARALFHSAERLWTLGDHLEVMPGAFAGSVCGRGLSGKASSTIGFERYHNRAFSIRDERAFVDHMVSSIPPQPPNASATRGANLGRVAVGV